MLDPGHRWENTRLRKGDPMTMSRRTISVLCAAAIAFAGVVVAGTPAQANVRPNRVVAQSSGTNVLWRYRYLWVRSDVINASLSMESYYSTNNAYPTTKKEATAKTNADKFVTSPTDSLTISTDGKTGYCILGWNMMTMYRVLTPKVYDSVWGGLRPDSTPGHPLKCSIKYPNTYTLP